MRVIEHRRHTMRTQPGKHLSQAGVRLARRVGENMGPFHLVVTSPLPRAFETAIAMGYAVDRQEDILGEIPDAFDLPSDWWVPGLVGFAVAVRETPDAPIARFASGLADLHRSIALSLPEGGRALVISHGGFLEAAVAATVPDFDYSAWRGCDYCEGARMFFDGGTFSNPEFLPAQDGDT